MLERKSFILLISIILGSVLMSACASTEASSGAIPEDKISLQITQVDTSQFPLVYVYVSARDATGNSVPVPINDIVLMENSKPIDSKSIQGTDEVTAFTSLLLIDNSGSMNFSEKLDSAKLAASAYIEQMRASDSAGIITFNTEIKTVQEITSDKQALLTAIAGIRAQHDTAMWDALMTSVETLNSISGRKAIILLTDGMDNESAITSADILAAIGEGGLSISTIGFGTKPEEEESPDEYEGIDEATLNNLAQEAGGIYGYAQDPDALIGLYDSIRQSLQSEVVISYITPQTLRDGVKRSLSVQLSGSWQNRVAGSSSSYNPGGLVPEVPDPENWGLFLILLGILLAALIIPLTINVAKNKKKKKKIRIKLKD